MDLELQQLVQTVHVILHGGRERHIVRELLVLHAHLRAALDRGLGEGLTL